VVLFLRHRDQNNNLMESQAMKLVTGIVASLVIGTVIWRFAAKEIKKKVAG
jgi:uncharacterized membrane-anchored protein YhcB (DUF1043 family)